MAPLPPDVAASRKNRLNGDLINLFKRPSQTPDAKQHSFKGVGLYTHVARPSLPPNTATPSAQRLDQSSPGLDFLPLGGPARNTNRPAIQGELPEEVRAIYRAISANLEAEAEAISRGSNRDPHVKFGTFDLSPSTLQNGPTPVHQQQDVATAAKRPNLDMLGGNADEAPARRASTDNVTKATSAGGTTYDSSRDPRRRGR
ncbi:hypothetical protein DM02DRAFT_621490 [Periconia macrospinosa]|uniref:Uncharacterized protein n=1 Tax=Periconia macrospinosa TaxID=97972 RepID=A0A2V1EH19_9PLEO|nr:hypothetical protein DM02DRAFT_621490 [Periconia macrospinosa]